MRYRVPTIPLAVSAPPDSVSEVFPFCDLSFALPAALTAVSGSRLCVCVSQLVRALTALTWRQLDDTHMIDVTTDVTRA